MAENDEWKILNKKNCNYTSHTSTVHCTEIVQYTVQKLLHQIYCRAAEYSQTLMIQSYNIEPQLVVKKTSAALRIARPHRFYVVKVIGVGLN